MGNFKSKTFFGYSNTPENAIKALEYDLQKQYPSAFVTLTAPDVKILTLSPRSINRFALARIEGKDYPVLFEKDEHGISAMIKL